MSVENGEQALLDLVERLRLRMGFALPAAPYQAVASAQEFALAALTEAIHAVSMVGLAMLRHKNNHVQALGESADQLLQDPSLDSHVRFQNQLFTAYRDIYGHIFPAHVVGRDPLPLYLRKYMQVLAEVAEVHRLTSHERQSSGAAQTLAEGLTFLANNWTGALAILRPVQGAAEGPSVEVLSGSAPPSGNLRTVPSQIQPGIYLLGSTGQPLPLHPFFYLGQDGPFLLRMLTSDGAFYRRLGREGYSLLFGGDLLVDLGEFLFRIGSYPRAQGLYRLAEMENRQAPAMVAALHHCLNARELSAKGDALKAAAEWDLCLSAKPDLPVLYHELAREYMAASRPAQATATINRLLERFPTSDEGFMALGDIYLARGDFGRAQRAFEKASILNPHHPGAQQRRADAQKRLESKSPAAEEKPENLPGDILHSLTLEVQKRPRVPLVGRGDLLDRVVEILTCRDKRNVLLVGEAGSGKTAIAEELARRLQEPGAPEGLRGRTVTALNLSALIAGARYRGQFEERVLEVVKRLKERGDLVLVENLHHLVSTGTTRGGSLDSASLLKPPLVKGEIQVVGTTDSESLGNILEKDPSLLKLFHVVRVEELSVEETCEVVARRKGEYEVHHGVLFPGGLVESCLELVRLSVQNRVLPESALDLMDRAGARVSLEALRGNRDRTVVTREDLLRALSEMSGISFDRLALLQRERLDAMEELLSRRVVDQGEAVQAVSRVVRAAKLGMDLDRRRPDGVLLFVGPSGVGKTALARALAEVLFGDEDRLIRIDMSEYMDRISTSRLIGTAPGYVGYYDQNQLTDQVRKNPYCVILFDEVEKADPQVLNLFLQVFDAGRLTDGKGRTVRFNDATIVMTSNLGAEAFTKSRVGYTGGAEEIQERESVLKEVRSFFRPEFLNRLDEVVVFRSLSPESLCRIVDLQLRELKRRVEHEGKAFVLRQDAREALAREGYSHEYGARNLGRALRRLVSEPLARLALREEWGTAAGVEVHEEEGAVEVRLLLGPDEIPVEVSAEREPSAHEVRNDGPRSGGGPA